MLHVLSSKQNIVIGSESSRSVDITIYTGGINSLGLHHSYIIPSVIICDGPFYMFF